MYIHIYIYIYLYWVCVRMYSNIYIYIYIYVRRTLVLYLTVASCAYQHSFNVSKISVFRYVQKEELSRSIFLISPWLEKGDFGTDLSLKTDFLTNTIVNL